MNIDTAALRRTFSPHTASGLAFLLAAIIAASNIVPTVVGIARSIATNDIGFANLAPLIVMFSALMLAVGGGLNPHPGLSYRTVRLIDHVGTFVPRFDQSGWLHITQIVGIVSFGLSTQVIGCNLQLLLGPNDVAGILAFWLIASILLIAASARLAMDLEVSPE